MLKIHTKKEIMQEIIICGVKITNPNKIIYKKQNITKLDVVNYYFSVAPKMLKYIKNRLLTVIRCHNGVINGYFFKKHPSNDKNMVDLMSVEGEQYFSINSIKELIYQVQMGTLEFHIWGSNVPKIDEPNLMVFDLDPDEKLPINKLRKGVTLLKQTLDALKLKSYLKTSGGKGYHVIVPIKKPFTWNEFAEFSHQIALFLEEKYPNLFTTNIKKINRKNKIFIDFLRNKKGATCVAPFSLRARDGAPISMIIDWKDLNKIKPNEINIKNYKKYLNF